MKGSVNIILSVYFLTAVNSSRRQYNFNSLDDDIGKKRDIPKVTFVKRLVPHGSKSAPFEYDSNSHTLFVPKFRLRRPINFGTEKETASDNYNQGPYKAFFRTKAEKQALRATDEPGPNERKLYYFVSANDAKKDVKPSDRNIKDYDFEKSRQRGESKSEDFRSARVKKMKNKAQHFKNLNGLVSTLQNSNNKQKRNPNGKYTVYSNGPVWQTVQKNPIQQKRNIKTYTVDDLVNKLKKIVQGSRHVRYLKNTLKNSAEYVAPNKVYMLKNEKSKPYNYLNNIFKVIKNSNSVELSRKSEALLNDIENNLDNNQKEEAINNVNAILDSIEKGGENNPVNNNTSDTKKLMFKSMSTFDFLHRPKLLARGSMQTNIDHVNNDPQILIAGRIDSNSPWEVLKAPQDNDVNNNKIWLSIDPENKLKAEHLQGLKRIRKYENELNSKETDVFSSEELFWRPIERPKTKKHKTVNKSGDLFKKLLTIQIPYDFNSDSDRASSEIEYPLEVIQKHKVQLLFPPLNKNEQASPVNPEKLRIYVRTLDELLKVWKYIKGIKTSGSLLRDRGTKPVVLDVGEPIVKQVPFNMPHYSIWNYWTYDKNLFHDNCPGEQAKIGNMCIWTPQHRK